MPSTLLLSFRAEDRAVAERLARRLFAAGVEPRLDGWLLAPGPTGEVAAARLRAVDGVCVLLGAAGALTDDPAERSFVQAHPRVFVVFGPTADPDRCPPELALLGARVDWRDEGDAGVAALVGALGDDEPADVSADHRPVGHERASAAAVDAPPAAQAPGRSAITAHGAPTGSTLPQNAVSHASTHGISESAASTAEAGMPAPDAPAHEADLVQRWRTLAWIAAATAALSGLLTVSALITATSALKERDALADARLSDDVRRVADLAAAVREDDPSLSLALAELSMRVEPTQTARSALLAALDAPAVVATRRLAQGEVHAAWAPDGRELTIVDGTLPRVWPSHGGAPTALPGHTGPITSVAWAPDGRIAIGSLSGRAWVWGADGQLQLSLTGHIGEVHRMAFGPTGLLLTVAEDFAARLWAGDRETPVARLPHENTILGGSWSEDGRVLTVSSDRTARVWSSTGAPIAVLGGHDTAVTTGLWLNHSQILTFTSDGVQRTWSADGTELSRGVSFATEIDAAAVGPDGLIVQDAGLRGVIVSRFTHPLSWEALQVRHEDVIAERSAWSARGQLLIRQRDGRATVWEPQGEKLTRRFTIDLRGDRIVDAAWAPAGQIYTASASGLSLTWDLTEPFHLALGPQTSRLISGRYASDGRLIAAAVHPTAGVRTGGDEPLVLLTGPESLVAGMGWGPNGRIVTAHMDDTVRVWAPDGTPLAAHSFLGAGWPGVRPGWAWNDRLLIPVHLGGLNLWDIHHDTIANIGGTRAFAHARFVPATGRILTVDDGGVVELWDRTGSVSARLATPIRQVLTLDVDPSGRALMTTDTGAAFVWSPDHAVPTELRVEGTQIRHARWGSDGRVYGYTNAEEVHAWTVPDPTSERIQTLEPFPEEHPLAPRRTGSTSDLVHPLTDLPPELVYAATFGADGDAAPDDAWMAIPDDGGVRVYTKGEHYATLRHPSGPMSLLAIGPNGRVLTESFDGVSRDWHLDDATLLALARPRTVLGFSAEQVHTLRLGPLLERRARPWAR